MKKKPEKTPEEIAEAKRIKEFNSAFRHQITVVKNACKAIGLKALELQLDFMKGNTFSLPSKMLNRDQTIECFEKGIEKYKEQVGF